MTQLIDGGLSTELENLGAVFDGPLWTAHALLKEPALIIEAHRNFVAAGAKVIITSSYQISRSGFEAAGLEPSAADDALRAAVLAAREAVKGTKAKVAASIGPYGATLHDGSEYRGNYGVTEDALYDFHRQRIQILQAAQPDILLAETIPDLTEAKALARALEDSSLPVWVSFTTRDAEHLWSGEKIADAIDAISQISALEVIGFNCVNPDLVFDLVTLAKSVSSAAIAVYPNRGGGWDAKLGQWHNDLPNDLASYWPSWSTLDLAYVGGCCGVDSAEVRELGQLLAS
ncbi:MAG: hypothetical protein RL196_129 [Actinomycetota bacterium]